MKKIKNHVIRTDLYYDPTEGFWVEVHENTARIGMSPLVQETAGFLVALRIFEQGFEMQKGEKFGSMEAEKHVGYLKTPVSGKITAINSKAIENPRLINMDPYGKGWLVEIEMTQKNNELNELISGEEPIISWFESEIKKYEEKGWLAEP